VLRSLSGSNDHEECSIQPKAHKDRVDCLEASGFIFRVEGGENFRVDGKKLGDTHVCIVRVYGRDDFIPPIHIRMLQHPGSRSKQSTHKLSCKISDHWMCVARIMVHEKKE
jgi:hypothetical protein